MENTEPHQNTGKTDDELLQIAINCVRQEFVYSDIVRELKSHGATEEKAVEIARKFVPAQEKIKEVEKKSVRKDMLIGGIILVIGISITFATYSKASSGGGRYVITYGAMIYGAIKFFVGLFRSFG